MTDFKFPFRMYAHSGDGRLINSVMHEASMEIIEIISGTVNIQVGTELLPATAGDFVYIPPCTVFRIDAVGYAAVRGMVFATTIISDNMERFDRDVFYMFDVQSRNKSTVFRSGHPVYPTLLHYMSESYDEYSTKDVCYKLPIRANIYLMMTALLRYYCGSKDESDRMVFHNVLRLAPVLDYISAHYCESKIYVDKLAEIINVSPDYFTKMFKDSIGKTPIDYINGLRVNKAMELLYKTKKSMSEIADDIGFCNPNYFHKIFKQYMDCSQLAYRKATL